MVKLASEFCKLDFKNPFLLASAPPTMNADHIIRAAKIGWAGAVTKTVATFGVRHPRPRLGKLVTTFNGGVNIGMENIELISGMDVKQWCEREIPAIKKSGSPDFRLIVSIMAGPNPDDWGELASKVEAARAILPCVPGAPNALQPVAMVATRRSVWLKAQPSLTRRNVMDAVYATSFAQRTP